MAEKIDDFLKRPDKTSKKKRLINASKQKVSINKLKPNIVLISTLDQSKREGLSILILEAKALILATRNVDIAMIGIDVYCTACKLKRTQVFDVSIKDLEYQVEKEARPKTNSKSVVLEDYHDFLNIFFKKNPDTLFLHQKCNYWIILEEEQKHSHASLYKILLQKLDKVKCYLDSHSAKGFIYASSASYFCPVFFVKKSRKKIRFFVDYWRLNAITKKNCYFIPFIEETLAQLKDKKYFTKIDICQAFY